jgi:hypothetical protein
MGQLFTFGRTHAATVSARGAVARADRRDEVESGGVAFLFGLTTPESVLVILPGELATPIENPALHAHESRLRLATNTRLRTFRSGWKKDGRQTTTCAFMHPRVDAELTPCIRLNDRHLTPPPNLGCS